MNMYGKPDGVIIVLATIVLFFGFFKGIWWLCTEPVPKLRSKLEEHDMDSIFRGIGATFLLLAGVALLLYSAARVVEAGKPPAINVVIDPQGQQVTPNTPRPDQPYLILPNPDYKPPVRPTPNSRPGSLDVGEKGAKQ